MKNSRKPPVPEDYGSKGTGLKRGKSAPGVGRGGEGGNKTYLTLNFSLQFYSFVILYS